MDPCASCTGSVQTCTGTRGPGLGCRYPSVWLGCAPSIACPNGTFRATGFTRVLIALQKRSSSTMPSHHLVAKVPGDPFGAVAPENDPFLKVDHQDSDLQALPKPSTNLGSSKADIR